MAARRCDVVVVIQDKLDAICDLRRECGVAQPYVFGSATRDDFRPGNSDLDPLVDFGTMGGHAKAHVYFDRDISGAKQMLYVA
jgi:predicted nucleotidyltransferase